MACLPFFTREGAPGVFAARTLDWSVDPERNLVHLTSEEEAFALGDKLTLPSSLPIMPGFLVAVIGPMLVQSLVVLSETGRLGIDIKQSFMPSAEGFYVTSLRLVDYEWFGPHLASFAKAVFDQEISANQGAT